MKPSAPARPKPGIPHSEPPITPLGDVRLRSRKRQASYGETSPEPWRRRVLLILLIIFLTTVRLTQEGIDLSLPPDVQPRGTETPPGHIVLEYSADRQITINRQPVPLDEVEVRLRSIFQTRRDKTLFVAGAPALRYGEIVKVVDAAKGAGVERIGVITEAMRSR